MRTTGNWTAASVLAMSMVVAGSAYAQGGSGSQSGSQGTTQQGSSAQGSSMGRSQDTHANRSPKDLQKFVQKAAIGNLAEIELSRLALDRAQDPEVKNYAQMMVDEHGKALEQLRQVASNSGTEVPGSLDEKHQKKQERLSAMNGSDFDHEYMKMMVASHKDMEDLLEDLVEPHQAPDMSAVTGTGSEGSGGAMGGTGMGSGASGVGGTGAGTGSTGTTGTTGTSGTGTSGTSGSGTSATGTSGSTTGTSGTDVTGGATMSSPTSIDAWAQTTLSSVRRHLEMAKDLEKRVKK